MNVRVPLHPTDPKISFPTAPCGLCSFDSSRYTSSLTEDRASRQEVDQVLKQFRSLLWKYGSRLLLAGLFLFSLLGIGIFQLPKDSKTGPAVYIGDYRLGIIFPTGLILVQVVYIVLMYTLYCIRDQKEAASRELVARINADFTSRDLKWQLRGFWPALEHVILWKGYKGLQTVDFGSVYVLDSSFYMSGMTHDRISYGQIEEVITAIKTSLKAINKKFRPAMIWSALLAFNMLIVGGTFANVQSDDGRVWPTGKIIGNIAMGLMIFFYGLLVWFLKSSGDRVVSDTSNILEQFNPRFTAKGFRWHLSEDGHRRVQLSWHQNSEEQSSPDRSPQTGAVIEFAELH